MTPPPLPTEVARGKISPFIEFLLEAILALFTRRYTNYTEISHLTS
jgi:hypothetical protein